MFPLFLTTAGRYTLPDSALSKCTQTAHLNKSAPYAEYVENPAGIKKVTLLLFLKHVNVLYLTAKVKQITDYRLF